MDLLCYMCNIKKRPRNIVSTKNKIYTVNEKENISTAKQKKIWMCKSQKKTRHLFNFPSYWSNRHCKLEINLYFPFYTLICISIFVNKIIFYLTKKDYFKRKYHHLYTIHPLVLHSSVSMHNLIFANLTGFILCKQKI